MLLDRKGVPRAQHAHVVAELLQLGYQQARRKMRGDATWTIDQLECVGAHFGETLDQVLEPVLTEGWESALLVVGTWQVQCKVLLGPLSKPPFDWEFVAIGKPGHWTVVPTSDFAMPAHEVFRLSISLAKSPPIDRE
jgi:hypothetical protein